MYLTSVDNVHTSPAPYWTIRVATVLYGGKKLRHNFTIFYYLCLYTLWLVESHWPKSSSFQNVMKWEKKELVFSVPTKTLLSLCSGHEDHCSDTLSRVPKQGTFAGQPPGATSPNLPQRSCLEQCSSHPQLLPGRAVAGRVTSCRPSCLMGNSSNVQPLLKDFQLAFGRLFRIALWSETLPIESFCFSQVSDQLPGWEGHLPATAPSFFIPCWHFLPVYLLHI